MYLFSVTKISTLNKNPKLRWRRGRDGNKFKVCVCVGGGGGGYGIFSNSKPDYR